MVVIKRNIFASFYNTVNKTTKLTVSFLIFNKIQLFILVQAKKLQLRLGYAIKRNFQL